VPEAALKPYEYSVKLDRRVASDRSQIAQKVASWEELLVRRDASWRRGLLDLATSACLLAPSALSGLGDA